MANTREAPTNRAYRADLILTAAIAALCVAVVSLTLLLSASERNRNEEMLVVTKVRDTRAEIVGVVLAQNDANAAAHVLTAIDDPNALTEFEAATAAARRHISQLRSLTAHDPALSARSARIDSLFTENMSLLEIWLTRARDGSKPQTYWAGLAQDSARVRTRLRDEISSMHDDLNGRIDIARNAENRTRADLDLITILLAAFSLVASGLAIFALRRERSQWRAIAATLRQAHASAAQSDMAKSRFLAAASHDMRQPLHALTLYLSALRRRVTSDEGRDILDKMERATQSIVGMFSTLLDLARIQAGLVAPQPETFSLNDLLDRVVAQHPGAPITVRIRETPLWLNTDPNLLERLLRNLVSNALKHGGGETLIEVNDGPRDVRIAIIDYGPGIPPEDQKRIFEEFVRLDGRASSEGLGLGLAIVQRLSLLLGFEIEVRSSIGQGAAFVVHAPAVTEAPEGERARRDIDGDLNGAQILILDDDPLALEAMARVVRDIGGSVRICADERELNAIIEAGFRPKVAVLDMRIGGAFVGAEIGVKLRARVQPSPVIVLVTGDTDPEALQNLRDTGFTWLIKPVAPNDFARAIAIAASPPSSPDPGYARVRRP